jgi:TonB family protein
MKTLTIFLILPFCAKSQGSAINCDSLFYIHSQHSAVWKVPELIGGLDSLQGRLNYPDEAKENSIEGKVYLLVIVDSAGDPICVKVIKGLGYGCDEEALYLIRSSNFYPGLERNKPISTIIAIPVAFSLKSNRE